MSAKEDSGQGWMFPILIMLRATALRSPILQQEHRSMLLGYLFGFTDSVEDDRMRALLNKVQFDMIFGDGEAVFHEAAELAARRDKIFMKAFGFGYPDGERFWEVCDDKFQCSGAQAVTVLTSLEALTELLKSAA